MLINQKEKSQPVPQERCMLYRGAEKQIFHTSEQVAAAKEDGWGDTPGVTSHQVRSDSGQRNETEQDALVRQNKTLHAEIDRLHARLAEAASQPPNVDPNSQVMEETILRLTNQQQDTERLLANAEAAAEESAEKLEGAQQALKKANTTNKTLRTKLKNAGK